MVIGNCSRVRSPIGKMLGAAMDGSVFPWGMTSPGTGKESSTASLVLIATPAVGYLNVPRYTVSRDLAAIGSVASALFQLRP